MKSMDYKENGRREILQNKTMKRKTTKKMSKNSVSKLLKPHISVSEISSKKP